MNKQKKFLIVTCIIIVVLIVICIVLPQNQKEDSKNLLGINYDIEGNETSLKYDVSNPVVAMYIENYGSIVIELYPQIAPNTVNNFISLVKSGFYDNNNFHRLMPDFVLQGGDPTGTGTGGPGYTIKGEFINNGFDNYLSHEKNVVSMARSGNDPDSAGSQFFICLDDAKYLDGDYAAFGRVIDGFNNLERIEKTENVVDTDTGKLRNNIVIKKAVIDLKGNEYPDVERIK